MDTAGEGEVRPIEKAALTSYVIMCNTDNYWEVAVWHREASLALRDI